MRVSSKRIWLGIFSVLFIAAGGVGLRLLAGQRAERMDSDMAEMSSMLKIQVQSELEHLINRITALAEKSPTGGTLSDADYEILDASIWGRSSEEGAFGRQAAFTHLNQAPAAFLGPVQPGPPSASTAAGTSPAGHEVFEREAVAQGFKGRTLFLDDIDANHERVGVLVLPVGIHPVRRVALTHFRLDRLQRAFRGEGRMKSALISTSGLIYADQDPSKIGTVSPLARSIFSAPSGTRMGTFEFDESGEGGKARRLRVNYRLVSQGQLAVVSYLPRSEAELSTQELSIFWSVIVLYLLGVGILMNSSAAAAVARRLGLRRYMTGGTSDGEHDTTSLSASHGGPGSTPFAPDWKRVAALHVSLWFQDAALEKLSADDMALLLNDFFEIGSVVSVEDGGQFERTGGASFIASWGSPFDAVRCALRLRQEYIRLSETGKVDGRPPITVVMGGDWGLGLHASVGPAGRRRITVVGEVTARARALAVLAPSVATDFLISHAFWENVEASFVGERAAEANLTALSGLTACYRIKGYRDEEGKSVILPMPSVKPALSEEPRLQQIVAAQIRWTVNNGTQIVGPFTPEEIAAQLYSMDLDFDCECWREGTGERSTIAESAMFGERGGAEAAIWVYDGKTVHGPMTEGFLKTALQHGAVMPDAHLCQGSTVSGWKTVSEFLRRETPVAA